MKGRDEDGEDESPGLIDLDMGQFGNGSMNDPLRHAMGLRSHQDAFKMKMWNSFPTLFQNTIFHGEQDASIKDLRHGRPLCERLARSAELKDLGSLALKAAIACEAGTSSSKYAAHTPATPSQEEKDLSEHINQVEQSIAQKERELRELRRQRTTLRDSLEQLEQERSGMDSKQNEPDPLNPDERTKQLEAAITNYEKAAGILRFVECVRPDWKNDDGSYKGIEDEHLRVDESALEGNGEEVEQAREVVVACYLNIALASQKLGKFEQMKSACDEILDKINPECVKALYRRAQARVAPVSAVDADMDAALQDLHAAAQLDPQNKDVRSLLSKLRSERKAQHNAESNKFAGLFDRGQVVTNDPCLEGGGKDKINPSKLDIRNPEVQRMLDIRPGPADF